MARCGIPRIDELLAGEPNASPLAPGESDREAVAIAQEFLRLHGCTTLPDVRERGCGSFGGKTRDALLRYRAAAGLGAAACVDTALLRHLISTPARMPAAGRGYLTLVLDFEYTAPLALVALTSLFESDGRFDCMNCNTDGAGLSFGIIQWAQKPGRLHELLTAFDAAAPDVFHALSGGDDAASALLAHTARPCGGVDPRTGRPMDGAFDLVSGEWKARFDRMGHAPELQRIQVRCAVAAFEKTIAGIRKQAPAIISQRGIAFMADLANQHGDGGARSIYNTVCRPGPGEPQLLEAMQRESVSRVAAHFGADSPEAAATADRRAFFRTTPLLSDAAL